MRAAEKKHKKHKQQVTTAERRERIARMYIEGKPQHVIGKIEGINQQAVSVHLRAIRQQWLDSALTNYDAKMAQELAKLDHLEAVAWDAWERSQKDAETLQVELEKQLRSAKSEKITVPGVKGYAAPPKDGVNEKGTVGPPVMTVVAEKSKKIARAQVGDAQFLSRIAWCIEMRCKLTGLVGEVNVHLNKTTTNINSGNTNTQNLVVVDWTKMYDRPAQVSDPGEEKLKEVELMALEAVKGKATPVTTTEGRNEKDGEEKDEGNSCGE